MICRPSAHHQLSRITPQNGRYDLIDYRQPYAKDSHAERSDQHLARSEPVGKRADASRGDGGKQIDEAEPPHRRLAECDRFTHQVEADERYSRKLVMADQAAV